MQQILLEMIKEMIKKWDVRDIYAFSLFVYDEKDNPRPYRYTRIQYRTIFSGLNRRSSRRKRSALELYLLAVKRRTYFRNWQNTQIY